MEYISNYELTILPLTGKELDWYEQGDEKVFHQEDKEELGSFISTMDSNNPQGRLLVKYNPR